MVKINTENIHNVLLLGHGGSGKTMLCESMLFNAKKIRNLKNNNKNLGKL